MVWKSTIDPRPAPSDANDWITTVLQNVTADEVRQKVDTKFAVIPELVEEACEQFLRGPTQSAHDESRTLGFDTVENVICDQIWTAVLGETGNQHVD